MEQTGDLKKRAEAAESRVSAKRTIEGMGTDLTDGELNAVSGGSSYGDGLKCTFRVINGAGAASLVPAASTFFFKSPVSFMACSALEKLWRLALIC